MELDRSTILDFLAKRRHGGATIRDLVNSMSVAPHQRRQMKRLLRELRQEGLVHRSEKGRFVLATESGRAPAGPDAQAPRNGGDGDRRPDRQRSLPERGGRPQGGQQQQHRGRQQQQRGQPQRGQPERGPRGGPQGGDRQGGQRTGGFQRGGGDRGRRHDRFAPPRVDRGGAGVDGQAELAEGWGVVIGRFTRNPEGYGFVSPQDRQGTDVFVPPDAVGSALHGDVVDVKVTSVERTGRRAGRIVGVRERSRAGIPGRLETRGNHVLVIPDDPRHGDGIWIARKDRMNAREGELVLVEVTQARSRDFWAKGRVTKVLGDREDPGVDSDLIIGEFGIAVEFSPGALAEAAAYPDRIPEEERRQRRDLTHVPFVTIDGATAKDFDDAVAVEQLPDGRTRLYVAIADVAHFVRRGSPLDTDAFARATSVYLPDRTVPMLPERLSNDLCSLRPDEERLALCCAMDIDRRGVVREHAIDKVIIRSRQRMTYDAVHGILEDRKPELLDRYRDHVRDFERMRELAESLRKRRFAEGSIDFDLPEPTIVLDLTGETTDIIRAPRYVSHRMIEEFMLIANVTVAKHFAALAIPLVYRVHDAPDVGKLETINEMLGPYGVELTEEDLTRPRGVADVLSRFEGKPEERVVNALMLRAMKQARYSEKNTGHFGLAFPHYCHFTSPIRRYPDLMVHRAVHGLVTGRRVLARYVEQAADDLPKGAAHSSRQERVAMDAERAIIALKKVRFMREKVGEVYAGHITGVTKWGMFVELDDVYVEGLIRLDAIGRDDQYEYDENTHRIVGRRSGRSFRIGDAVTAEIINVSLERRAIDFKLVRKTP